jgi:hypothetical protein
LIALLSLVNVFAFLLVVLTLWNGLRHDPDPNDGIEVIMYLYLALAIINLCSPLLF